MNKIKTIIILFLLFFISSCGGNNTTIKQEVTPVKGSGGVEYTSYEDACRDNDFVAAYKFIELNGGDKDYVFKQEALFLMSQESDDAKKRLIYLIKQEDGNNSHVAMLIDLAIEDDDEDFVKKLANQFDKYVSSSELKALSEYLLSKNNEENEEFLLSLYRKLNKDDMIFEYAINKGDIDFIVKNASNIKLDNDATIDKLSKLNNNKVSEIIIGGLTEYENSIPNKPAMGIVKSDHYGDIPSEYTSYESGIKSFNDKCRSVMNCAIKTKNQYLAKRALSKIKPNIEYNNLGDWVTVVEKEYDHSSVYNAFKVTTSNDEIVNAKATFQEALNSGAFR